ncbi:hypothetical protein [Kangiella geojedonensis]|uniref:Uncharacterized protein n=1 Tax=Kangiella geojedonensis TaxID=914150 RepID=A0A0F6RCM9_9GAMM|nr:hypothetical protein [Kangiella geojedonensis]AKE52181.1 hypothetical protein TQ33_1223 [Kangiella geojedonensis]
MKTWLKITSSAIAVSGMLLLAVGSDDPSPRLINYTNKATMPIMHGVMEEGLTIVAEDESFELKGGQRFLSPFQSNLWGYGCDLSSINGKNVLNSSDKGLRCGGKKVHVFHGNNPEPLYGVLVLNSSIAAAKGPASRSYMIKVPDDKIEHAREGNTAVAFEIMKWDESQRWSHTGRTVTNEKTAYGWILWVSAYPL